MLLHLLGDHVDPGYRDLPARSLELDLAREGRRPLQRGAKATVLEIIRGLPLRARYYERETYAGIPARASRDLGREYLEFFANETATACSELLAGSVAPEDCFSPLWPIRRVFLSDAVGWVFDKVVRSRPSPV